ncbi:clathrin light chain B isoform X3 [Rhincodon typus]|uniref:clathrin light chain B isoform X3 n=1 Tax=Rhincodon typus TaxID=259920 RepID=UPI00202E6B8B|nr:clathrin light chain B isoform X3 [Rhincodon typus]
MNIGNGSAPGAEVDPAAAFLEQHYNEIDGIEREQEAVEIPGTEAVQMQESQGSATGEVIGEVDAVNGDSCQENGADAYSAISQADKLPQEPDSIRKWREEQIKHLAELDANSREAELEWREKAKKDLEDWYIQQAEHLEEMKTNNRSAEDPDMSEGQEGVVSSEWEHVLHLCDLNAKTSKVSKDVSRMRSVLMSLSQVPLTLK